MNCLDHSDLRKPLNATWQQSPSFMTVLVSFWCVFVQGHALFPVCSSSTILNIYIKSLTEHITSIIIAVRRNFQPIQRPTAWGEKARTRYQGWMWWRWNKIMSRDIWEWFVSPNRHCLHKRTRSYRLPFFLFFYFEKVDPKCGWVSTEIPWNCTSLLLIDR